jgi:DNA-binding transcriptional LysR family regulator
MHHASGWHNKPISDITPPFFGKIEVDRFEAMTTLIEVVEQGSLSAASRSLRVPVTTVSRRVTDLEALVGTRLLVRTTRKLSLTDAGAAYLQAARRIVGEVAEAEREAAGEFQSPRGELVITAPLLFGRLHVLPLVAEFLGRFSEINVRLMLSDRNVHLVDDHVDMAVRIGKLPDSELVATRVGVMRSVICASPALLARHGVPQSPEDLARLPCVSVSAPMPMAEWLLRKPGSVEVIRVAVAPRLTVSTAEAAADAAMQGIGAVRLLHYQVAEGVRTGRLRLLLQPYEPEPAPLHLVHAARGQMPLKMRLFIDFAAPRLREALLDLGQVQESSA